MISLKPFLPARWKSLRFFLHVQGRVIQISISQQGTSLRMVEGEPLMVLLNGEEVEVK